MVMFIANTNVPTGGRIHREGGIMEKIIRKETGHIIGWADTNLAKGVGSEYVDRAGYAHIGVVAETMKAADVADRVHATEKGILF